MKTVAVLGGGPAGASAAERLASAGLRTIVIDEKLAWEKPCGGGITYKAYSQYRYLIENDTPKKLVTDTFLAAPRSGAFRMALTKPLVIYSRIDLNRMLLDRAEAAGAQIEKERVLGMDRVAGGWQIRTRTGKLECRLLRGGYRRPQPPARSGHAVSRPGHYVRLGLLGSQRPGAHRHPISAEP